MIYSFEQRFPSSINLTVVIGIRTTERDHEFLPDANVVDKHFLGFSRSVSYVILCTITRHILLNDFWRA